MFLLDSRWNKGFGKLVSFLVTDIHSISVYIYIRVMFGKLNYRYFVVV